MQVIPNAKLQRKVFNATRRAILAALPESAIVLSDEPNRLRWCHAPDDYREYASTTEASPPLQTDRAEFERLLAAAQAKKRKAKSDVKSPKSKRVKTQVE